MRRSSVLTIAFLVGLLACQPGPDKVGTLDVAKWRSDRGGCNGVRATLVAALKAEKEQLRGKSSNDIGTLLGRPDINQLVNRNQKFYVYFLEKGPHCDKLGANSTTPTVALRMSAIGLVTEITFQNGVP